MLRSLLGHPDLDLIRDHPCGPVLAAQEEQWTCSAPERDGEFILGVECDGAAYHSAKSARDRDRLRQEILERKEWRIHRIWSADWFKNRDREVQRLLNFVRQATEEHRSVVTPYVDACGGFEVKLAELLRQIKETGTRP